MSIDFKIQISSSVKSDCKSNHNSIRLQSNNLILDLPYDKNGIVKKLTSNGLSLKEYCIYKNIDKFNHLISILIDKKVLIISVYSKVKLLLDIHPYDSDVFAILMSLKKQNLKKLNLMDHSFLQKNNDQWELRGIKQNAHITIYSKSILKGLLSNEVEISNNEILLLLYRLGFLRKRNEKLDTSFQKWEFHDLLFQKYTSTGESPLRVGATFKWRHKEKLPAPYRVTEGQRVKNFNPAYKPTSFINLLKKRKSQRDFSQKYIKKEKLLDLSARLIETRRKQRTKNGEYIWKLYPSGGALHEEEFYFISLRCDDLPEGVLHLDQKRKGLYKINSDPKDLEKFINYIPKAVRENNIPQLIILVTSKLPRRYWKYEGIGLKNSLLTGGVILDQVYIHCTDLKLKCCAIGGVKQGLVSKLINQSPYEETVIATIAVGI